MWGSRRIVWGSREVGEPDGRAGRVKGRAKEERKEGISSGEGWGKQRAQNFDGRKWRKIEQWKPKAGDIQLSIISGYLFD